jgi:hypothetical protein
MISGECCHRREGKGKEGRRAGFYAAPVIVLILPILLPNTFLAVGRPEKLAKPYGHVSADASFL